MENRPHGKKRAKILATGRRSCEHAEVIRGEVDVLAGKELVGVKPISRLIKTATADNMDPCPCN